MSLPWLTWAQPYPKLTCVLLSTLNMKKDLVIEDLFCFFLISDNTFFQKFCLSKILSTANKRAVNTVISCYVLSGLEAVVACG